MYLSNADKVLAQRNALDCHYTAKLYQVLQGQLHLTEQQGFYHEYYGPMVEMLRQVQIRGLPTTDLGKLRRSLTRKRKKLLSEYFPGISTASNKQLHQLFVDKLGLRLGNSTKHGYQSFSTVNVRRMLKNLRRKDEPARAALEALLAVRDLYQFRKSLGSSKNNHVYPRFQIAALGDIITSTPNLAEWTQEQIKATLDLDLVRYPIYDMEWIGAEADEAYAQVQLYGLWMTPLGARIRFHTPITRERFLRVAWRFLSNWDIVKRQILPRRESVRLVVSLDDCILVGYSE